VAEWAFCEGNCLIHPSCMWQAPRAHGHSPAHPPRSPVPVLPAPPIPCTPAPPIPTHPAGTCRPEGSSPGQPGFESRWRTGRAVMGTATPIMYVGAGAARVPTGISPRTHGRTPAPAPITCPCTPAPPIPSVMYVEAQPRVPIGISPRTHGRPPAPAPIPCPCTPAPPIPTHRAGTCRPEGSNPGQPGFESRVSNLAFSISRLAGGVWVCPALGLDFEFRVFDCAFRARVSCGGISNFAFAILRFRV
jgi:hypothetical protein